MGAGMTGGGWGSNGLPATPSHKDTCASLIERNRRQRLFYRALGYGDILAKWFFEGR